VERSSDGAQGPATAATAATAATVPRARRYEAGEVICGKYRLRSLLGEGGMGAVWLARNEVLDVDVAIKLIRHGIGSAEASERLLQEARAAARLEHPSIIRIFDFGATAEGDPFIAMEMLRGESLAQMLDRGGRLSASDAVRILLPVAGAVCAAHAKGIIHRDLKPDNVLLTENDSGALLPKVVDFGIAKVRDEHMAYRSLTQAGAILGSPDYMCPEQARGRNDVDEKCDVWALAVMLYECIAGRRPFNGDNYNALLASIVEDAPTPTTELAAGDEALWGILSDGLSKDRTLRPTMRLFGERLAQWALLAGAHSDISGVSLGQWLTTSTRRSGLESLSERPSGPTSRRSDVPTRPGTEEEQAPPHATTSTNPPVANTRSDVPRAPTRRVGLAGVAVVVSVVLVAIGVTVLRPRPPHDAPAGAQATGENQALPTASPTAAPPPTRAAAPSASASSTASPARAASSEVASTASAAPPAAPPPRVARPGRASAPPTAKPDALSVPDRPNF
jgi:serine/threonine-protein kinase